MRLAVVLLGFTLQGGGCDDPTDPEELRRTNRTTSETPPSIMLTAFRTVDQPLAP